MIATLLLLAAAAADGADPVPAPGIGTVFSCDTGTRRISVVHDGRALVYRFGTARKEELRLALAPGSGRVFYHNSLYPRGEDQTLRFVNGRYSYVVYSHWTAPSGGVSPEIFYGGVLVVDGERTIATHRCRRGGDMREWPVFKRLPRDEINRTVAE